MINRWGKVGNVIQMKISFHFIFEISIKFGEKRRNLQYSFLRNLWYAFLYGSIHVQYEFCFTITVACNLRNEFLLKHQFGLYNLASITAICRIKFRHSLAMSLSHISFSLHRRHSNQKKKRWSPAHQRATEN